MLSREFRFAVICGAIAFLCDRAVREGSKPYTFSALAQALGISRNCVERHARTLQAIETIDIVRKEAKNRYGFEWSIECVNTQGFQYTSASGMTYTMSELFQRHNEFVNKNSAYVKKAIMF